MNIVKQMAVINAAVAWVTIAADRLVGLGSVALTVVTSVVLRVVAIAVVLIALVAFVFSSLQVAFIPADSSPLMQTE